MPLLGLVLALSAAAVAQTPLPPPPPDPTLPYRQAISAMARVREPAYLTYTMRGEPQNLAVGLTVIDHFVWLGIHDGNDPSSWQARHRTDDYATELIDENGRRYVTGRSFFDPTWYGAYRALRDGMLDYQDQEAPVSARATPPPATNTSLREIAVTSVAGPGIYKIEDKGATTCPSGDPGRAFHLVAKDRAPQHQLSNATVHTRTGEFCMLRFSVRDGFGFSGVVEQHYADVNGYWLQTDGFIDGGFRLFGISTHHGVWRYTLEQLTFPRYIYPEVFITPLWQ